MVYKATFSWYTFPDRLIERFPQVSDSRIVIAVDASESNSDDSLDLPERCRVLKLANSVTFDRLVIISHCGFG